MTDSFVKTKSSLIRKDKPPEFQEVVFQSYKSKPKNEINVPVQKKRTLPDQIPKREDEHRVFMKKARYDVIKFGMTGFDAAKKEETKQALAISLGAKPRKRKGINYKDLKETRLKEREEKKAHQEFQSIGKTATGHASAKIKHRIKMNRQKPKGDNKGGILGVYGKVKKQDVPKK